MIKTPPIITDNIGVFNNQIIKNTNPYPKKTNPLYITQRNIQLYSNIDGSGFCLSSLTKNAITVITLIINSKTPITDNIVNNVPIVH